VDRGAGQRLRKLNGWLRQLCEQYPTLRRGGLSFPQLKRLLHARAQYRGLSLKVKVLPWHVAGSLRRVGSTIHIKIDSQQSETDKLRALAHEAGHLLFGHYELEGEVWTLREGPGADEWEQEADYFAMFATRTPGTPAEWFIGGQLDLL